MENLANESLLVDQMQSGNQAAFTALYRYYSPRMYINILPIVRDPLFAEEIVQELFTRIWQKRESTGIKENFAGYMYRIGQNLVHDFFRKMQRDRTLMEKFRILIEEQYEHIEEWLHYQESAAILNNAIEQLSPQQKKVYHLVKVEGYTYKKAAEIMGISVFTVKEYLVATKKSIQNYMMRHMDGNFALLFILITYTSLL